MEIMQSDKVEVVEVMKGFLSIRAKEAISAGSFISDVWGPVLHSATPYTIQVGVNEHVDPFGPLKRTNHFCQPNSKFIFERRYRNSPVPGLDGVYQVFWYLVATRDIKKDEDVTFDYTTTEYEMSGGFKCRCGEVDCLREVKGFKFLTPEQKIHRKNKLSPVVAKLYNNESRA